MRVVMGLSTLVIAAVALLWLAMAPSSPSERPPVAATGGQPPRAPQAPDPAPAPDDAPEIPAAPASAQPAQPPEPAPAEPARHQLITPRATPVPRPIQAIPTPGLLAPPALDPPPARVAVQAAVQSAKPLVADCYEQALRSNPTLGGTLKVSFSVTPDAEGIGRIREAEVIDGGLRQPFLEMCVLEALGKAEYPSPEGANGEFKVTYPFVLQPGD